MWLSKIDRKPVSKRLAQHRKKERNLNIIKTIIKIMIWLIVILSLITSLICCDKYYDSIRVTETHTLKIVDKIIDVEYDGFGSSSETYYFVLEEYGMVRVYSNEYNSYMIGDMYEHTYSYIPK